MLYQLYETQRAMVSPFAELASAASKLYEHPLSAYSHVPFAQRISAGLDLAHRLSKDYEKPEFNITSTMVGDEEVAVLQQVALQKPFCRLLRFKRFTDDQATLTLMRDQPTVLVVAPLSGHHATLLRETVRMLLKDHKVFITDWTDARMVPFEEGPFHLDDYVTYIQEFIRLLGPEANVISVCQPTVPVLAAISLMATAGEPTPRTMTMMGGPIDARLSPTAVNNLAMNKSFNWFDNNVIYRVPVNFPGNGRRVYPGFLQHTGFVAMNPDRHVNSHYDYFLDLVRGDDDSVDAHRAFYDEYNAVLDMPAEYYLDTIRVVFQDFALVNGTWHVNGQLVRPQDITKTALLTVEGELDDISGAGQTHAAHGLCTGIDEGQQFRYNVVGAGHYGIFSGRRWREKVYPEIRRFIAEHQSPLKSAPSAPQSAAVAKSAAVSSAAAPIAAMELADSAPARTSTKPVPSVSNGPAKRLAAQPEAPVKPAAKSSTPKPTAAARKGIAQRSVKTQTKR
jgi:poly(3-hydroxybutyrate) depolymerase